MKRPEVRKGQRWAIRPRGATQWTDVEILDVNGDRVEGGYDDGETVGLWASIMIGNRGEYRLLSEPD